MQKKTASRTSHSKAHKPHLPNPFDSDSDSDLNYNPKRTSSAPVVSGTNTKFPQSSNTDIKRESAFPSSYASRSRYKNDFNESGGFESQSVQELEGYAAYKAEETTQKVNDCLRIAEEMRGNASETLVNLHHQGEQITHTHITTVNVDYDLSRGEKILGSLGGLFSKTWKPKKGREIKGPMLTRDDSYIRRSNHKEQRARLGLSSSPTKSRPNHRQYSEPVTALDKVQVEKEKQEDALSDLSNILGELKGMAINMGSEIEWQNKALDHLDDNVEELNVRVKGVNVQTRRLLRK